MSLFSDDPATRAFWRRVEDDFKRYEDWSRPRMFEMLTKKSLPDQSGRTSVFVTWRCESPRLDRTKIVNARANEDGAISLGGETETVSR